MLSCQEDEAMGKKIYILLFFGLCTKNFYPMPPALANTTGSACYLNSLTQNLYNLEPITKEIMTLTGTSTVEFLALYKKLIGMFQQGLQDFSTIGDNRKVLADYTKEVIDAGNNIGLKLTGQSDPSEAFMLISGGDPSDPIIKIFKEKMAFQVTTIVYEVARDGQSMNRSKGTPKIEPYWNLIVPYPSDEADNEGWVKVSDALDAAFKMSINRHANANHGTNSQVRIPRIYGKCPEILMLWVKVFDNFNKKIPTKFNFSETSVQNVGWSIDLKPYVVADENGSIDNDTQYTLIGFCAHGGDTSGDITWGHYIAWIKDQYDPARQWYQCDDRLITSEKVHNVLTKAIYNGYLFFYRKVSSEAKSIEEQKRK